MVKVSIIPTLLIWIIVTCLRISNHIVKANNNNRPDIQSTLGKYSEENRSINSTMIDERTPIIGMMTRKDESSSPPLEATSVKLKFTPSNLRYNPVAGIQLTPITETDLLIQNPNRTSDLDNPRINQRTINVTSPITDKNEFHKRSPASKIDATNSADSVDAFNGDEKIERVIENVNDYHRLNFNESSFEVEDENLKSRDNVPPVSNEDIEKTRRFLLELDNEPEKLTLVDFKGPSISQDVESSIDDGSKGSEHIRVKRDLSDSDSLDEIRDERDLNAQTKDNDNSDIGNELNQRILIRRKRYDHEIGFSIGQPEVRSGIDERETQFDNSYEKLKRRKKRYAQQLQLERVSRGGKKKSHHLSRKHKHRKRPKSHRQNKQTANFFKENGKRNDDNKLSETITKLTNKPREISAVVADQLQVESRMEKRDSGDARSEIEVRKREVSKGDELASKGRETQTAGATPPPLVKEEKSGGAIGERDDSVSKLGEDSPRVKRHESEESVTKDKIPNRAHNCRPGRKVDDLKYYDGIHETDRVQRAGVEPRTAMKKTRRERAAKSVNEIKDLMDILIGKVEELDTYVRIIKGDGDEQLDDIKGKKKKKKKRAEEEVPSSLTRCVDADLKNIKKSDEDPKGGCVDKTDGDFKSKLETERSEKRGEGGISVIASQERKRSTDGRTKRNGGADKSRKKRKPHRKWDRWTDWSSCSVTCGKGRQIRWRHCVHDCTLAETEMEEKTCQLPACGPGKFLGIF